MEILARPQAERLVHDILAGCTKELLAARPATDPVAGAAHRDTELLRRGVRVRVLYPHTVRSLHTAHDYARTVTELGARLRTVDRLPGEVAIVDGRLALLEHDPARAIVISEQCLVHYLSEVFEHLWDEGWAMPAASTRGPARRRAAAEADPKPAILRLLAEGAKDEMVARRLGLSVRTCRRHIADVMAQVGAVSRFQAGVLVIRHGLLGHPAEPVTIRPSPE